MKDGDEERTAAANSGEEYQVHSQADAKDGELDTDPSSEDDKDPADEGSEYADSEGGENKSSIRRKNDPAPSRQSTPKRSGRKGLANRARGGTKKEDTKWTEDTSDIIAILVQERITAGDLTENKWQFIEAELLARYNISRTSFAIKNYWSRKGRALYNLDERRIPNPQRLTTSVRGRKKGRKGQPAVKRAIPSQAKIQSGNNQVKVGRKGTTQSENKVKVDSKKREAIEERYCRCKRDQINFKEAYVDDLDDRNEDDIYLGVSGK